MGTKQLGLISNATRSMDMLRDELARADEAHRLATEPLRRQLKRLEEGREEAMRKLYRGLMDEPPRCPRAGCRNTIYEGCFRTDCPK